MRRLGTIALVVLAAALGGGWWLTAPGRVQGDPFKGLTGDPARGKVVFEAAGCASCHAAPKAEGAAKLVLAGGRSFVTAFGTFYAPNISPSPQGIGDWTARDLMNALVEGTTPQGTHLYPVLPYASYRKMTPGDVLSLWTYLRTLPPSAAPSKAHQVSFPFSIRRGIGLWKLLFLDRNWVMTAPPTPQVERGRYLVEALGHCGECHTPRGPFGEIDRARWLQGAPNPVGKGRIPGLTPDKLDWSAQDIAIFLQSGVKPNFDTAGGQMAEVVENWSHLTDADRADVAAYLKALPGG